jgi:hypothetical protein
MLQFYFLSILFNLLTGLVLIYATDFIPDSLQKEKAVTKVEGKEASVLESENIHGSKGPIASLFGKNSLFDDKSFRLVLGILTFFTGIMKLLSVIRNDVPVVGDLLPALAGLIGGFCVLFEYYLMTTTVVPVFPDWLTRIFVDNRKTIGIICIVAAVLHFIFPTVLFL